MRKTSEEIEEDVFKIVQNHFKTKVKGKVYRKGYRPADAKTEDIVVMFMAGTEAQTEQSGVCLFNIYVPHVPYMKGSQLVPDKKRIGELLKEVLVVKDQKLLSNAEYWFEIRNTPSYEVVDGIEQDRIPVRINYRRKTF